MTAIRIRRWSFEPWALGLLLGGGVGLLVLGIGGRVAMRAIALASNTPPAFSIGGTLTVVALGGVSGVAGGLLYALLHLLVPRPRIIRSALFFVALVLLTLRGLRPIQPVALNWFLPLTFAYGAMVDAAYTAWSRRRSRASTAGQLEGQRP